MKSFKQLLREPNFAIALAAAFIIAGWDLAYGSWWIGAIFVVLLMTAIALNVWKTRKV